jgi:hypothetical protein
VIKQCVRGHIGFKRDDGIDEARLVDKSDGFGGIERRAANNVAQGCEARDGCS